MIGKLLTEPHLEFLNSTRGCRGSSESTLVKMSNCWKSPAKAHYSIDLLNISTGEKASSLEIRACKS